LHTIFYLSIFHFFFNNILIISLIHRRRRRHRQWSDVDFFGHSGGSSNTTSFGRYRIIVNCEKSDYHNYNDQEEMATSNSNEGFLLKLMDLSVPLPVCIF
jgi:hypothetical protein